METSRLGGMSAEARERLSSTQDVDEKCRNDIMWCYNVVFGDEGVQQGFPRLPLLCHTNGPLIFALKWMLIRAS